jgi:hypothetical protein
MTGDVLKDKKSGHVSLSHAIVLSTAVRLRSLCFMTQVVMKCISK